MEVVVAFILIHTDDGGMTDARSNLKFIVGAALAA